MPDNNPPTAGTAQTDRCRRCRFGIFIFDVVVVIALLALGVLYVKYPGIFLLGPAAPPPGSPSAPVDIAVRATWFGALGGIVIGLKGVYDHCCQHGEWDDCFDLWHIGRPISGGLTGLITLVLLLAVNTTGPNEPAVYAIAFIFGTQERRFFNFLSEVAALVVRVPNEDQKATGLKITGIQPAQGKQGDAVRITGQNFAQGATVTIGTNPLANAVVAQDGTSIAGNVPAGAPGVVDVTVVNPNGDRAVLKGKFTYTA
jgi:hypothetical protein